MYTPKLFIYLILPLSWSETKSANGSLGASDADLDLVGTEVGCKGTLDIKDGAAVCGANGTGELRTAGRDGVFLGEIALVVVDVAVDIGGGTKESANGFNGFMGGATDALNWDDKVVDGCDDRTCVVDDTVGVKESLNMLCGDVLPEDCADGPPEVNGPTKFCECCCCCCSSP